MNTTGKHLHRLPPRDRSDGARHFRHLQAPVRTFMSTADRLLWLMSAILFLGCLVLGGGSGGLADPLLQILSLLVILGAAWRCMTIRVFPDIPVQLLFAGILLLGLIQLAPLPPAVWQQLDGRAELLRQMASVGVHPAWYSHTLSPIATERALFWMLPGMAMYLSVITLTTPARMRLIVMLLAVTVLSLLLAIGQIGSGPASVLRFYDHEKTSSAIGFFANRNHFACMLAMAIPLAVAMLVPRLATYSNRPRRSLPRLAIVSIVLVVLLVAVPMTNSRAGIVLGVFAAFASLGLLLRARLGKRIVLGAMAIAAALFLAGLVLGINRLLPRLEHDPAADPRWTIHETTLIAARHFGSLGSGLGTFPDVYQVDAPEREILPLYVNTDHAYGDYHELWLETGWPGIILIGVFGFWYVRRTWQVWLTTETQCRALDLARAASLSIAVVLAHSWLDYPLRTTAVISLLGVCCGLMSRGHGFEPQPDGVLLMQGDRPPPQGAATPVSEVSGE